MRPAPPPLAALHRGRMRRPGPAWAAWLAFGTGAALACMLLAAAGVFGQSSEELINRVSDPRLQAYEDQLTWSIRNELVRYIWKNQFVVSAKLLWNPELMPVVRNPAAAEDKQKLPGFPIFVRAPNAPPMEEFPPPFTSLTVRVLLDDALPDYYERFVRKLVPVVARFDSRRGDQVIVAREKFPPLNLEQRPPPLPEKELKEKLGEYAPAQPEEASRPAAAEKLPWGADFEQWTRVTGYLYSRGHGQRLALVRAAPAASAELRIANARRLRQGREAPPAKYPAGTVLAMETWEVAPNMERGAPGPLFFMRKEAPGYDPEGGDWRYAMTRADLTTLAEGNEGLVAGCRTCHMSLRERDFVPDMDR